jgi:hypothetical protein
VILAVPAVPALLEMEMETAVPAVPAVPFPAKLELLELLEIKTAVKENLQAETSYGLFHWNRPESERYV